MNIEFVGKDLPLTDALKERIERRLEKIETRLHQKLYARVKFGQETTTRFTCSVHFTARGEFNSNAAAEDLFKAADDALKKVERQVSRTHDKSTAHHRDETIRTAGLL